MCVREDGVYFGHQKGNRRRSQRGEPKWRVAQKNGSEEDSEGQMGTKQSGVDRCGFVAQEQRRCQDGWRAS